MQQYAVPDSTYEAMLKSWGAITTYHESGSIYLYDDNMLLHRFADLSKNPELVNKYFNGILPTYIDAKAYSLEDVEDWEAYFHSIKSKADTPRVYLITGINSYLLEGNKDFFAYLKNRQIKNPLSSYLCFFSLDFTHPQFNFFQGKTSISQNVIIHALPNLQETLHYLRYLENKWRIALPCKHLSLIAKYGNGQLWLVKQAIRSYRDNPKASPEELLTTEIIKSRTKHIYDSLLPSEQSVLGKIAFKKSDFTQDEYHSISFLLKTGWIHEQLKTLKINSLLLEEYVYSLNKVKLDLRLVGNVFYLGDTSLVRLFSKQESLLLVNFLKNKNILLKRAELGSAIWGNKTNYSDWALDRLISRLRKKLSSIGLDPRQLRSVKGKGIIYES